MFTILVIMAIVTTLITSPLFWLIWLKHNPSPIEESSAKSTEDPSPSTPLLAGQTHIQVTDKHTPEHTAETAT